MNVDVVYWSVLEDWDDQDIEDAIQWVIDSQSGNPRIYFKSVTLYSPPGVLFRSGKNRGGHRTIAHAMVFSDEPLGEETAKQVAQLKMEQDGTYNTEGLA